MSLLAFVLTTFESVRLLTIPETVSNCPGWRSFREPIVACVDPLDFSHSNGREWDSSSIRVRFFIITSGGNPFLLFPVLQLVIFTGDFCSDNFVYCS